MDKRFLNKVVGQLVYETRINYEKGRIQFPFFSFPPSFPCPSPSLSSLLIQPFSLSFNNHCREVYGLNYDEVKYVWNNYRDIVKDKIDNNG
jgi:hypothetical protein